MAPTAIVAAAALALAACAAPSSRPPAIAPSDLLASGSAFGTSYASIERPEDVAAVDENMRAFVARYAGGKGDTHRLLTRLLNGIQDEGLHALDYEGSETSTARETFYRRRGNCLSFTVLFVALAREAGLDVRYQLVDVPPMWSGDLELVMLNSHINAVVKTGFGQDYVVDFNLIQFNSLYPAREISDAHALALYYSNRGVEAMNAGRLEASFGYLRAALVTFPALPGVWVNLGVLFSRRGLPGYAESAYLEALRHDSRNPSAVNNLAGLYHSIGEWELADEYAERARRHQMRNPYYHFSVANSAYLDGRPADALESLDKALKLKRDEHQFYFLQGLAQLDAGEAEAARASFNRAYELAEPLDIKRRYATRIAALGSR